jgi:hypothetical protein
VPLVAVQVDGSTGDEWQILGRALAAEDAAAYVEAKEILRELVERVRRRNAKAAGALGFPVGRGLA